MSTNVFVLQHDVAHRALRLPSLFLCGASNKINQNRRMFGANTPPARMLPLIRRLKEHFTATGTLEVNDGCMALPAVGEE